MLLAMYAFVFCIILFVVIYNKEIKGKGLHAHRHVDLLTCPHIDIGGQHIDMTYKYF